MLYRVEQGVATLCLNRPEKLNAVTVPMARRISDLIREANQDDAVRVLIVTGAGGKAFCVGTDVSGLADYGSGWQMRNRESDYALDFLRLRKPAIAAIRGHCIGGGLEIALLCDIRIVSESGSFAAAEVKLGWNGAGGASQMLPRLVGYGNALQMLLTGAPIDAREALRIGLAQKVVADGDLESAARDLAESIAANAPIAAQVLKHAVRMSLSAPLDVGLAYENDLFTYCMTTSDSAEGIAASMVAKQGTARCVIRKLPW